MTARWVCLDVGETLVDETRVFATWAEVLGVPAFTLSALMGGMIARSRPFTEAFTALGVDAQAAADEVEARYGGFATVDLYPDALPVLDGLRERGYRVAIVANQPARRHDELRALGVEAEVMAMSGALGVAKPDPAFFARALELMGDPPPGAVAYVGDRIDNDVVPAAAAGLRPVWIRRGPWSLLDEDADGRAALEVSSLTELAERVDEAFA